ncbi:MAG: hypothetical protein CSA09_03270 [Candidatus Contendobacter odensis]|uniref:Uncharacterized protein n=1 Tax=Candidatus Contendibacter odensensis TaxID=1400860 RepID=A0A2G6PEV5_9GAMM|nr:MAG: hypothetical protein CSA09_03270 [Candidatus Contendobacter odensis]
MPFYPARQDRFGSSSPWLEPKRESRRTLGTTVNGTVWRDYPITWQDGFANAWWFGAKVFYATVNNSITFDHARGQSGVQANNGNIAQTL